MDNKVPDERVKKICEENQIGTEHIAVEHCGDSSIRLLNHVTRDHILIVKGDRKW